MDNDFPQPVPGPSLADKRRTVGIEQKDLAERMGIHRTTLNSWEKKPAISPVRAARYNRALRELVAEAVTPEKVPA